MTGDSIPPLATNTCTIVRVLMPSPCGICCTRFGVNFPGVSEIPETVLRIARVRCP